MKSKFIIAFILLLFPALSLTAREQLKIKTFKYYKNISGLPANIFSTDDPPYYGSIEIDNEMIQHGSPESYRISYETKEVPYFIRNISESYPEKKYPVELVYNVRHKYTYVTVLKMPELDSDECITGLEIQSRVEHETGLNIQYSNDPENWNMYGYRSVYQYRDSETNRIDLDCLKTKYLRISTSENRGFDFSNILTRKAVKELSITREITLDSLKITENPDTGSTVIYFDNAQKYRIEKLVLAFNEKKYSRYYSIEYKNPVTKRYGILKNGQIESQEKENTDQFINLYEITNHPLKIIIENYDDEPLTLTIFKAVSPREEIIFQMNDIINSESKTADSLKIYYGNEYIRKPDYDISNTYDSKLSHLSAAAGAHGENPEYAYSIIEPPLSVWITRILFLTGLVILLIPGYKIFKKYASEIGKSEI